MLPLVEVQEVLSVVERAGVEGVGWTVSERVTVESQPLTVWRWNTKTPDCVPAWKVVSRQV